MFIVVVFALHSWLIGQFDAFPAGLLGGAALLLVLPVLLAANGVSLGVCLVVVMLSPVVTIVGFEARGHRHQADVVEDLTQPAAMQ